MTQQNIILGVVTVVGIALIAIMYQAFVVIPKEEIATKQAEIEAKELQAEKDRQEERNAELRREQRYLACTNDAYINYSADWDSQCTIENKEADCTLPGYLSQGLNDTYQTRLDTCVALYKSN